MNLKQFEKLVQPRSKVASIMPFTIGLLFTLIIYRRIEIENSVLFFFAMLIFDMTTSSINVVMDYFKSSDANYRQNINPIGKMHMNIKVTVGVTLIQLIIATVLSLILVSRVGLLLLLAGLFCFAVGIFYTYGPLPISRLPISDLFAGFTMGFVIPFITVLVNTTQQNFAYLSLDWPEMSFYLNMENFIKLLLVTFPAIVTTFNMKLANDLCDVREDKINERYTLPVVIGVQKALKVYSFMPYLGYGAIVLLVIYDWQFFPLLLIFLTLIKVRKNIAIFQRDQIKAKTYVTANYNLRYETLSVIVGLLILVGLNK